MRREQQAAMKARIEANRARALQIRAERQRQAAVARNGLDDSQGDPFLDLDAGMPEVAGVVMIIIKFLGF